MPEIWIPYGDTETLISLQAENLGELIEPAQDSLAEAEIEQLGKEVGGYDEVIVCDYKPSTVAVLQRLVTSSPDRDTLRITTRNPRRLESGVPDLKGKVHDFGEKVKLGNERKIELEVPPQLTSNASKLVLSTAEPDPLFGVVESRIALCLSFMTNAREFAYESRASDEPSPFSQTASADSLTGVAERFPNSTYATVIPRGSRPHRLLRDAPFDTIRNSFVSISAPQAKAAIIGIGGRGYDDTLSNALRIVWGSLNCVRASGEILLICECGDGLGSRALELLISGRIEGDGPKKGRGYVEGLEEIHYLTKLKATHSVILMSGLPELYARTKLGFATARGSGEAVSKLLGRLGRTTKVNVVTRACECALTGS